MTIHNPDTYGFTKGFTDPFRYAPHPLVRKAAEVVMKRVHGMDESIRSGFEDGKMLGVLVVGVPAGISDFRDWLDEERRIGFIAGFSGSVAGLSHIEGFVPPIFDLMDPNGHYKQEEEKITALNDVIIELKNASEFYDYKKMLWQAEAEREAELMDMRERMAASKKDRARRRAEGCDPEILIRESQHEKAELKRLKVSFDKRLEEIKAELADFKNEIEKRKQLRASMSDALQQWLFSSYIVHNFLGEEVSISEIFTSQGLTPPGGTGECAAPKLLEHAYSCGLTPLAMGEFWYGRPSETAVRVHGHFYPSCTSKCGPLLKFMMKGNHIGACAFPGSGPVPEVIFEDDWIAVVVKPAGMPSVPGLDGRLSVLEWLNSDEKRSVFQHPVIYEAVHRLDMDTSGIMVFARTPEAAVCLRRQFEMHTVSKTYMARLSAPDPSAGNHLEAGDEDVVRLSIGPDYDERPRQKADPAHGKDAVTEYEVEAIHPDGSADVLFHPVTGRTHQLRVHSAHTLGLGRPILGDLLYGGYSIYSGQSAWQEAEQASDIDSRCIMHASEARRLHLHAFSITFRHPSSGEELCFSSRVHCYR